MSNVIDFAAERAKRHAAAKLAASGGKVTLDYAPPAEMLFTDAELVDLRKIFGEDTAS